MQPGEVYDLELASGRVLYLLPPIPDICDDTVNGSVTFQNWRYCPQPSTDLTGSLVSASHPLAVIVSHRSTAIPYAENATDYVEDLLPPVDRVGRNYVVVTLGKTSSPSEPRNLLKIVAADTQAEVVVTPASGSGAPRTVRVGPSDPVEIEISDAVTLRANEDIVVQQVLLSATANDGPEPMAPTRTRESDPSLLFPVPVEWFRRDYRFVVPQSYDGGMGGVARVALVRRAGSTLFLDGEPVDGEWRDIDDTWQWTRALAGPGVHALSATERFGATLCGVGPWVSFATSLGYERPTKLR